MKISLILVLLAIVPVFKVAGQHVDPLAIDPELRKQWIEQTRKEMEKFRPDTCSTIIEPKITDLGESYYSCSYRVQKPGMIRISPGQWIYLVPSSSHDNPGVGDITLAMDQKRQFYVNYGHVCGGIIHFHTRERMELTTSRQFFLQFVSDTDSIPWVRD